MSDDLVGGFVEAWARWARLPASETTVAGKERAARALAGDRATGLLAHVASDCRATGDPTARVRTATLEWLTTNRTGDAA
jgi:hypothetical protein